jgi:hypothetical protein
MAIWLLGQHIKINNWIELLLEVTFQILSAIIMMMAVFWDVSQCSRLEIDQQSYPPTASIIRVTRR